MLGSPHCWGAYMQPDDGGADLLGLDFVCHVRVKHDRSLSGEICTESPNLQYLKKLVTPDHTDLVWHVRVARV